MKHCFAWALVAICMVMSTANADDFGRCNIALEKEFYDSIEVNNSNYSDLRENLWERFLSMSESEAYDSYLRYHDSQKEKSKGGAANAVVKGAPIKAGYSGKENEKMSQEEFQDSLRKVRELNAGERQQDSRNSLSYASHIIEKKVNERAIEAWERCVLRESSDPVRLYGFRSPAGHTFVKVIWDPGDYAALAPQVEVKFVEQVGIKVATDTSPTIIAVGTGATFAVLADPKFDSTGIDVHVTASLRAGDKVLRSDTAKARIPALIKVKLDATTKRKWESKVQADQCSVVIEVDDNPSDGGEFSIDLAVADGRLQVVTQTMAVGTGYVVCDVPVPSGVSQVLVKLSKGEVSFPTEGGTSPRAVAIAAWPTEEVDGYDSWTAKRWFDVMKKSGRTLARKKKGESMADIAGWEKILETSGRIAIAIFFRSDWGDKSGIGIEYQLGELRIEEVQDR